MTTGIHEPALVEIPAFLWQRAMEAPHRLLMADYDGTLAPFRTDRREAVPLNLSISLLRAIARSKDTTVAIISGRPVRELEAFTGGLEVTLVGENGWEEKSPDGLIVRHPLKCELDEALRRASTAAASRLWGWRLERKRAARMLHTRGLSDADAAEVRRACEDLWRPEASAAGLDLVHLNGGIELRAPGRNKGTAARDLLAQSPAGTYAVHIGDDEADEDAFRVILDHGCGIRIGDPSVPSIAQGRLASWIDLPFFLKKWLEIVESGNAQEEVTM